MSDELLPVNGVTIGCAGVGIKYKDRDDLVVMKFSEQSKVAGTFTQNHYCAAPVILARENLRLNQVRAFIINSGNANAGTGEKGIDDARQLCNELANYIECESGSILPFSTGVIGELLPVDKIKLGIAESVNKLDSNNWHEASKAILTTDTVEKGISRSFKIEDEKITITGIAKGSGMICPNMATMLSFIATDASISQAVLDQMLHRAVGMSFNRITVDGDTSTNDACMLVATCTAEHIEIDDIDHIHAQKFYHVLEEVCLYLAKSIIRDAEGATKFVNIHVNNCFDQSDAKNVAYSVAHSPLVKTALFACDPNWGRILAAVGKSDVKKIDIDKINIYINEQAFINQGQPDSSYMEEIGQEVFSSSEIDISIDLGMGDYDYTVWTSDLSYEYVTINSSYRS